MLQQGRSTAARESIRKHSRSFSFASRLLPADRRADVEKLYAWCRWCDDGVDMAPSPEKAATFVQQACDDLNRIAAGEPPVLPESGWLASLTCKYDLSIEAAKALLKGMESDLSPTTALSEDDLLTYCFRAAGSVGRFDVSRSRPTRPAFSPSCRGARDRYAADQYRQGRC